MVFPRNHDHSVKSVTNDQIHMSTGLYTQGHGSTCSNLYNTSCIWLLHKLEWILQNTNQSLLFRRHFKKVKNIAIWHFKSRIVEFLDAHFSFQDVLPVTLQTNFFFFFNYLEGTSDVHLNPLFFFIFFSFLAIII